MNTSHNEETYKSLLNFSIECFRFLMYANGGAIVAILTFAGNLASKGIGLKGLIEGVISFVFGIFFCLTSVMLSYVTQYSLHNENNNRIGAMPSHQIFLKSAAFFAILSCLAFLYGSVITAKSLESVYKLIGI